MQNWLIPRMDKWFNQLHQDLTAYFSVRKLNIGQPHIPRQFKVADFS